MGQPHPNQHRPAIAEGPPLEPRLDAVRTLPQWLARAAHDAPTAGIVYVAADGTESVCTYAKLLAAAGRRLKALRQQGLQPGQKVILLIRNTPEFIELFWGCLLGGLVPVLLPPPKSDAAAAGELEVASETRRLAAVWQRLDCPGVIVPEPFERLRGAIAAITSQDVAQWWTPGELESDVEDTRWHLRAPSSTAFLLFSSGSTREPQGVQITHDNVWADVQGTCQHNGFGPQDTALCWAPLYHVIGLVCFHLLPIYARATQVMLEPATLLKRPELWFDKISKHRVSYTGGPNFAYSLATNRIDGTRLADWDLSCLRVLLNGGEVVSVNTLRRFYEKFRAAGLRAEALAPAFGMSELAGGIAYPPVDQPLQVLRQGDSEAEYANLGDVLPGLTVRIVNEQDQLVDEGVVGNIQIRGRAVTPGYEGNPTATAASFVDGWFRTGDLGFLDRGQLAVVGRSKDVIIVHGHNYYAFDLEQTAREVPGIVPDRVVAAASFNEELGRERVIIFAALQENVEIPTVAEAVEQEVLRRVGVRVDEVVPLSDEQFPRTPAGKIHRYELKRLYDAGAFTQEKSGFSLAVATVADQPQPTRLDVDRVSDLLAAMLADVLGIDVEHVDPESSFVELGIDSVLAVQLVRDLEDRLTVELPTTLAYEHPNIQALAAFLAAQHSKACAGWISDDVSPSEVDSEQRDSSPVATAANRTARGTREDGDPQDSHEPIAIVGMSARLPGANTLAQYWSNLSQAVCSIREIPAERWDVSRYYSPRPGVPGKTISKWAGILDDVDRFDAKHFGISPHEAQRMDPQQRLLLEVCWETLESAGYAGGNLGGSDTGVFVGISLHDYMRGLLAEADSVDAYVASGNFLSIAANRLSYVLDLKGPSMAVDTACSSSLVALHLAVSSLRRGECHAAIVGAAHLHFTPELYVNFSQAGMLSPEGQLKAFDRRANGYVRGEGVAAVMLKPLADALRDGDHVHAVIRGTAVNQDGRTNGLTAPNRQSQVEVIRSAQRDAGVTPGEISYVEAHGTGTVLGDPIELQALAEVFASQDEDASVGRCGIGSVKTNLGHLEPASGLASLIKVVLSLEHQQMAPTLHFEQPNDHVRFEQLPLYVVDRLRPWPRSAVPRIAGISGFGFGGTNAHVVVEEPPMLAPAEVRAEGPYALTLSAQTAAARAQLAELLAEHLESHPEQDLTAVCFTANTGRRKYQHRAAVVASNRAELVARLRRLTHEDNLPAEATEGTVVGDIKDKAARNRLLDEAAKVFERLSVEGRRAFHRCCRDERLPELFRQEANATQQTREHPQRTVLLTLLGLLDTAGFEVDWSRVDETQSPRRVPLPTYPFERQHFPLVRQDVKLPREESKPTVQVEESSSESIDSPHAAQRIRNELAAVLGVTPEEVDPETNYNELGLDSIMATHVARRLDPDERYGLDALSLFTYPTVRELAEYLEEEFPDWHSASEAPVAESQSSAPRIRPQEATTEEFRTDDAIAVVGMACRMPGAASPEALWRVLREGKDMVGELPEPRRELHPSPPGRLARGGFLEDVSGFDPAFFGLTLREARLIDPQQRIMLEVAWQAINSSGHRVDELSETNTGVFVGVAHNDYEQILQTAARRHDAHYAVGNAASMVANRISYTLNLTGPSLAVDTACSSSLVAVHMACESLRSGESTWAIAGGVNLILLPDDTLALNAAGMLSADALSKAFDDRANGYVRGEGAGAVLLRPLSAARAAGDTVLAVIRGSAVNHDGHSKVGVTAPNPKAQRLVIEAAYRRAHIQPSQVSMLEAHGTGTRLGDPIEVQALGEVFGQEAITHGRCALGSIKSNVGHLEAAAGIAGLIKVVLSLHHQEIPPTLHVETPNRHVAWTRTPFYVNERLRSWESEGLRIAGVSSFGAGGTNAHVVLEEAPLVAEHRASNVLLPNDPFKRQSCWVDVPATGVSAPVPLPMEAATASASSDHTLAAEQWLLARLCEVLEVPAAAIDPGRPIVESGLDSMLATQVARLLEARLAKRVPQTICFDHPTVKQLAAALVDQYGFVAEKVQAVPNANMPVKKKSAVVTQRRGAGSNDRRIAIIGIGGRFPDAPSIDDFWRNLAAGHDSVREVPPERWSIAEYFNPDRSLPGKTYSKWGALLEGIDRFDAPLFHISPREAAAMDPQQRLLLEVAWETLERAGYAGGRLAGTRTGVFVGTMASEYLPRLLTQPTALGTHVGTGNSASVIANRLSYLLNFKGPCLSIDTACSSSLVALHLAVESLRRGECEYALVGGTQAGLAVSHYQVMSRLGALSPTGRCRAFDTAADGYVLGEGVGLVMLKPLERALADRDHVEAVILGTATSHGGQAAGLTVPSAEAQAEVIREALADADVPAESISYIEAHGTGTRLGDPIELQGLSQVFAGENPRPHSVGLGSVKTNIGHLEPAAGIAGLLKVVLSLRHAQLPPTLHLKQLGEELASEWSPFYVNDRLVPWPKSAGPRRAGVSAFGFGGTNAHVVIEEAPPIAVHAGQFSAAPERSSHVLVLSARDEKALDALATRWGDYLKTNESLPAGDVTYTSATGREHFAQRLAIVGHDTRELTTRLCDATLRESPQPRGVWQSGSGEQRSPRVAVMFSGQGAQYAGMGRVLYDTQPVFREAWDASAAQMAGELEQPLSLVLQSDERAAVLLSQTAYTQPALFALQHGLWAMWQSWGLNVGAVLGHSVGEFAAACAAGVMAWSDGARLVAQRARLMQALPPGGMMAAVLAPAEAFAQQLARYGDAIAVAALNSPSNTVVSGDAAAVEELFAELRRENIACQRLDVSHAFHSSHMDAVLEPLRDAASRYAEGSPRLPWIPNLSGEAWTANSGSLSEYWPRQARNTVRFATGVEKLFERGFDVLLELGPGTTLTSLVGQIAQGLDRSSPVVLSVPSLRRGRDDWESLSTTVGQLYARGVDLDWDSFHQPHARRRLPLPTYAFQHRRYWVDELFAETEPTLQRAAEQLPDVAPTANWFHEIAWRPLQDPSSGNAPTGNWLIVERASGIGHALATRFKQAGCRAQVASIDSAADGTRQIALHADQQKRDLADFEALFEQTTDLTGIVFVAGQQGERELAARATESIEMAAEFVATLARRADIKRSDELLRLCTVTFAAHAVSEDDASVDPAATAIVGLMRTVRLELPALAVQSVDLPSNLNEPAAVEHIACLVAGDVATPEIAIRNGQLWEPGVVPSSNTELVEHLSDNGVFLITGGLGGLGLETARWLAARGAPKLALLSRRGAVDEATQGAIEELRAAGAEVLVISGDVGERDSLSAALQRVREAFGSIDGIFQAAGVTDDALLRNLNPDSVHRVLRAKVQGTLLLDELTRQDSLREFVLYSSLASLAGNVGQAVYAAANAFLDGYTAARRAAGAHHLRCVNWGPWSGVGMAADAATARKLEAAGLTLIEPAVGRGLLAELMNRSPGQSVVFQLRAGAGSAAGEGFRLLSSLNPPPNVARRAVASKDVELTASAVVREAFATALGLPQQEIDGGTSFHDLGLDSLLAEEAIDALRRKLRLPKLPTSLVYEYPTAGLLSAHLAERYPASFQLKAEAKRTVSETKAAELSHISVDSREKLSAAERHDIAIVGYACRLPGCEDADAFWRVLRDGVDCVAPMPEGRWEIAQSYDPGLAARFGKDRPRGGFLRDVQSFDPQMYRISPAEARQMDPRQRLFLEVAYQAAEHAGYGGPALANANCGVFVGCGANDYLLDVPPELLSEHSATGSTAASVGSRLAYCLNLRGPCLPVDTACSSSLVALHLATESLRRGECRYAFAGAVHLHLRLGGYQALKQLGALSPDGQCRPFDDAANGFVPAEGVGVVLLRPLADAVAAGDQIYGVIKGTAVNNDGRTNGLTAPSPQAQIEVLQAAWRDGGIDAETISYVEAHGTGTVLGDPIEAQALSTALGASASKQAFCGLGSVKSNLGHLDAAAGMASLIKVLLSFEHERLPASLHIDQPNHRIAFDGSPLSLVTASRPWPREATPRRAGISAFGFSGTNAHVLVEEPPRATPREASAWPVHLLTLSAHDGESLQRLRQVYGDWITRHPDVDLGDVCFTAAVGRWHLAHRTAVVAKNPQQMAAALATGPSEVADRESHERLESPQNEAQRQKQLDQAVALLGELPPSVQRAVTDWCGGPAIQEVVQRSEGITGEIEGSVDPRSWSEPTWHAALRLVAQLYVLGAEVDFFQLECGEACRRVALPTSPLRREKYWLPISKAPVLSASAEPTAPLTLPAPSAADIESATDNLFHELHWEPSPLAASTRKTLAKRILLLHASDAESASLAEGLVARLESAGAKVLVARLGNSFAKLEEDRFEIDSRSTDDYGLLLETLKIGDAPTHIVHLGGCSYSASRGPDELEWQLDAGLRSVLHLVRALDRQRATDAVQLTVVTRGAVAIDEPQECTSPEAATVWGLLKVAAIELPQFAMRIVDFARQDDPSSDIDRLVEELSHESSATEIGYRKSRRFSPSVRSTRLAVANSPPLKPQGVYVITGGLGGIGLALARRLAQRYSARLVLLGRTPLDEQANGASKAAAKAIAELQQAGAPLWCTAADVADRRAMTEVLNETRRRFGPIDGVFHCAGTIQRARLREVSDEQFDAVLRAKVQGTWVLDELLGDDPQAALVLFSSVAGIDGNVFQGDYSAASRFLDSFAAWRTAQGRPTISIDWGLWAEVGMGAGLATRLEDRGPGALSTAQALSALEQALASGRSSLIIDAARSQRGDKNQSNTSVSSSTISTPRKAQVEEAVAAILAEVLETDPVRLDRRAGLLDFGLDSMLALKLVQRLEAPTGERLLATLPFDYPTIEALAARLVDVVPSAGLLRLVESSQAGRSLAGSEPPPASLSRRVSVLRSVDSKDSGDHDVSSTAAAGNGNPGSHGEGREGSRGLRLKTGRRAIRLDRRTR